MRRPLYSIMVFSVIICFFYVFLFPLTEKADAAAKEMTLRCWRCQKSFTVPTSQRKGQCPHCGSKYTLPPPTPIPTPRPVPTPSPIPGTEPEAPPSISWRDGARYAGLTKTVKGTIVGTHLSSGSGNLYLNFDPDYKTYLSIKIPKENVGRFPSNAASFYQGKTVIATGQITREKNYLRLIVTEPDDLVVVR